MTVQPAKKTVRPARGVEGLAANLRRLDTGQEFMAVAVEDQQGVVDADADADADADEHQDGRGEVGDGEDVRGQGDQADGAADREHRGDGQPRPAHGLTPGYAGS
jgi:hypothetical protein